MKIVYCTDIHDAIDNLETLLHATDADVYLLSGDILYLAFYDEEKIYQFVCLQEELNELRIQKFPGKYPYDLTTDILRFPERYDNDQELIAKANEYRSYFNEAAGIMKEKYARIEELIVVYGQSECRMLPGNYDIDLRYTALEHRSLHHKSSDFAGLRFSGYGGAPIATSGIPEKLAVVFHESYEDGHLYSEPELFFRESDPDVIMIHNPAYGYFDRMAGLGHVGSQGIREYLDSFAPSLVLSGHVHEDHGIMVLASGTVLMNPSNFGGVDSPYGRQEGGAFAEITMEGKTVKHILLRRLLDGKIHDLLAVDIISGRANARVLPDAELWSHIDLNRFVRDAHGNPIELK